MDFAKKGSRVTRAISNRWLLTALLANSGPSIAQEIEPTWDIAVGGVDTVFLEEMTAGEIAAAIRNGRTSVIVATGGLEQNGPNVATGKHNYVLRVMTDSIARAHGNMLVSSIVQFVPDGIFGKVVLDRHAGSLSTEADGRPAG